MSPDELSKLRIKLARKVAAANAWSQSQKRESRERAPWQNQRRPVFQRPASAPLTEKELATVEKRQVRIEAEQRVAS